MNQDETPFEVLSDQVEALDDVGKDVSEEQKVSPIVSFVRQRYNRAKTKKYTDEQRFITSYRNYRGLYGADTVFTDSEKSRIFVKVTKTKVLAAYGQIVDVLFGNNKFPLTIEPSRLPEGIAEAVSFDPAFDSPETKAYVNQAPLFGTRDGPPLPPGATQFNMVRTGAMAEKLKPLEGKLVEGQGRTPSAITIEPAMLAAKRMEKKIQDQLEESSANQHLRSVAFEMALFGTGIMKGPFAVEKEYPRWSDTGEYDPEIKTVPVVEYVSVWNFYPDPDAANMEGSEYAIQRHKLSKQDLKQLKNRPFFRPTVIDKACEFGPDYQREWWEMVMEDESSSSTVERFEALEFWGYVDAKMLRENGIEVPRSLKDYDQLNVNIWVCNGQVIRCIMNPFKPTRIPYQAVPYEINPYSFFGVGIAENMEDTQILMNGFMRMAVDNAVLSGNLIFEIDENNLSPGQDLKIYPGKVFKRQGGAPGQSIFGTEFPNVSQQNMMLFDKARVLADESTGLPSYSYGQTNINGVGRTASGISMFMNAAASGIKTVVKNIDDYLLAPLGKALFAFNMQFDFDPSIKGDLKVVARGTESLMANEVRSQSLLQFLCVVANPMLAPFAKMDVIVRDIAKTLDLDPDKIVNNLADAGIQAEMLKGMMGNEPTGPGGLPTGAQGMSATLPPGAQASDPTGAGGGSIGTGSVPAPGTSGFSANTGQV